MDIKELLARRSDLSTFLIHLTREYPEGTPAKDNLKSILNDKLIEARNAYGSAISRLESLKADNADNSNTQMVVCFTETPLEHVRLLVEPIEGRKYKFEPYGIAITKRTARVWDVNPAWGRFFLCCSKKKWFWSTRRRYAPPPLVPSSISGNLTGKV